MAAKNVTPARKRRSADDVRKEIAERIRAKGVVDLARQSPIERLVLVRAGLPAVALDETAALLEIPKSTLTKAIGIAISTAGAQRRSGKPLTSEDSEKLLRVLRASERAREIFGDSDEARSWILGRVPALGDVRPLDLLDTQDGYELVDDELERIVFGAPA